MSRLVAAIACCLQGVLSSLRRFDRSSPCRFSLTDVIRPSEAWRVSGAPARRRSERPRRGRGSSRSRPPRASRRRGADRARQRPLWTPPMPTTGICTAAPTALHLGQRDRAHRRARDAAGPSAQPRLLRCRGSQRHPPDRVDQRQRAGPGLLGGRATAATSVAFGRQLDDQRLVGQRPDRVQQPRDLVRVGAHHQPGLDVRAGDVELERRHLVARRRTPRTSSATSSRLKPITLTISGTGSAARARAGRRPGSRRRPLLGSPIEFIMPAGSSHRRGGGLPWRGASVTVLETNAANGKRSSSSSPNARRAAIASNVPEALMIGCGSSIPQKSTESLLRRWRSMSRLRCPGEPPVSSDRPSQHRAVDAQPDVAAAGSARRSRSRRRSRTPSRTRAPAGRGSRAPRTAAGRPRASPAARRRRPRRGRSRSSSSSSSSVTSPWWPTLPSSVATWASVEQLGPGRVRARRGSRAARASSAPSWSCQIASGAIPTPPPTSSGRRPSRGGAKPMPSGPTSDSSSPGSSSHRRLVPGPTSSIRNCSSTSTRRPARAAR